MTWTADIDQTLPDGGSDHSARRTAASLPRRYLAVLTSVAVLLLLDQAVIQPLLLQVSVYAPTINVAGRQRMLSQRLSKSALLMQSAPNAEAMRAARRELGDALTQLTRAHRGLLNGDHALGLPPTTQPAIRREFAELAPHFEKMAEAAQVLVQLDASAIEGRSAVAHRQVEAILQHEAAYLPTMDRIVGLYEREARQQVSVLRLLGLAVTVGIILLMIALAYLVLRPANRTILEQVELLEARVLQRTAQLTEINRALKHEIQERQQADRRNRQLSDQLAHASRVTTIGQLSTGLAHEINQPLAAISNYAETCSLLLQQQPVETSKAREAVQRIGRAALRAGEIVRRMRNFVRPQSAKEVAERVDVNDLIGEVCDLCEPELLGADVALRLQLSPELPVVEVDPIRIQQVLVNLIQNAVHALQNSPRDQRRLTIRTSRGEDLLQVAVVDNGPGFAAEDADALFNPFFTTRKDGLGMGLAISRSIVEQHGGRLSAERNPNGGAVVYFTLPASRSDGSSAEHNLHSLCR